MTVKDSTLIRIPNALKAELEAEAAELLRLYQQGNGTLPPGHCQHVPLHYVIKRALEHVKAHRARAKAARRKASILRGDRDVAACEGRVNTIRTGSEEVI